MACNDRGTKCIACALGYRPAGNGKSCVKCGQDSGALAQFCVCSTKGNPKVGGGGGGVCVWVGGWVGVGVVGGVGWGGGGGGVTCTLCWVSSPQRPTSALHPSRCTPRPNLFQTRRSAARAWIPRSIR